MGQHWISRLILLLSLSKFYLKLKHIIIVLSSRTDFSVDMSGQFHPDGDICRQNNGQEINAVMFRPKSKLRELYAMDHRDWPDKQRLAEHQACRCTNLQCFSQTVKPFWRLILSICCVLNESFLYQNSTLLCRQNRIFVDMSYFLKIAVLSPFCRRQHNALSNNVWTFL